VLQSGLPEDSPTHCLIQSWIEFGLYRAGVNMKSIVFTALALCVGMTAIHSSSNAQENDRFGLRHARICDPTGCYMAWNVIDSDGDGFCDADELMAGSNPYDPLSRPSLRVIAKLGSKALLPSFEAGQGAFFVYSIELQSTLKKSLTEQLATLGIKQRDSALTAFPLHDEQKDSLGRLGISAQQLADNGIDVNRDSFTVGLEHSSSKGAMPGRKVNGIDVGLISAEEDPEPLPDLGPHGGKVKDEVLDGDHFVTYKDGVVRVDWSDGGGMSMDKNGKVLGRWYINPDADQGSTAPTEEQFKSFERLRGATIRTVEGWSAPTADTKPSDPQTTIILIDPEYGFNPAMIFDVPLLTTAQPEKRQDLPGVDVPANPGSIKSGCDFGCSP
jgi:hypothetical protein